jgi:hypothetical protein
MRILQSSRRWTVAAVAVVLLVAAAGTAFALGVGRQDSQPPDGSPAQFSPHRGDVPVLGSTPEAALHALAARFPDVASVSVSTDQFPSEDGTSTIPLRRAHILVDVPSMSVPSIAQALWESGLLAGAIASEYAQLGAESLGGAETTIVTPDGMRRVIGGGLGKAVPDQVFDSVPSGIASRVASAAASRGISNVHVTKRRVLQDALVIHASSAAPAQAAKGLQQDGLQALLGESPSDFEGVYLELDDSAGHPMYISATAPRAAASFAWADPSLGLDIGKGPQVGASSRG